MGDYKVPADLKYARTDEWLRVKGEEAEIGITDYAQDQLSDIVFVELPSVGDNFQAGASFGVVESVKAAADLNMPVSGDVVAVNEALEDSPEMINSDAFGAWIIRIRMTDKSALDDLMDADAYVAYSAEREE